MSARSVARFGLLAGMALVLGYLERLIPIAAGIPGIKLGLANTVLLYAVYTMDKKSAALLMMIKVLLSGFLFAGLTGMLYSLAGGVLSLVAMLLLHRAKGVGVVGVSVAGGVCHNIGQIAVACLLVRPEAALSYLPILLLSGVITGILTGVVARLVMRALEKQR